MKNTHWYMLELKFTDQWELVRHPYSLIVSMVWEPSELEEKSLLNDCANPNKGTPVFCGKFGIPSVLSFIWPLILKLFFPIIFGFAHQNPKPEMVLVLLSSPAPSHCLHQLQTSISLSFFKTRSHDGSAHTFGSSHQFLEVPQKGVLKTWFFLHFYQRGGGSNRIHINSIKKSEIWHGGQLTQIMFTHTPCGSVGLQMDFFFSSFSSSSFFFFFLFLLLHTSNFVFLLGTEHTVGGGAWILHCVCDLVSNWKWPISIVIR